MIKIGNLSLLTLLLLPHSLQSLIAADQAQWGKAWSRNMVSSEVGLLDRFEIETGLNVKWKIPLGTESHSTPTVSQGRILLGTNNGNPRDPKHQGDRGVFMCLDERTGDLLWQLVVPKRDEDPYFDWPRTGISSPATIDGDRVYLVDNRGVVLCLDLFGMANGNDGPFTQETWYSTPRPFDELPPTTPTTPSAPDPLAADILWAFNLTQEAGIWSHDGSHSSILIHGSHLYLNTGTGVDNTHKKIRTPEAPSLIVLDKMTGRYLARENEQNAGNIFHCTWSSPSLGTAAQQPAIFFAGGDGIVYGYKPISNEPSDTGIQTLEKILWFDFDPKAPKDEIHRFNQNRLISPSNFFGMPVFHDNHLYIAGGGDIWWGKNQCWIKSIRTDGSGDQTDLATEWSYTLNRHVMSTPAIHENLLFIADCGRQLHCLDVKTGLPHWTHEVDGDVWASPLVADGKVFLGTRRGQFLILEASAEKRVLLETKFPHPISATATAANGVLYVTTMQNLFALHDPTKVQTQN